MSVLDDEIDVLNLRIEVLTYARDEVLTDPFERRDSEWHHEMYRMNERLHNMLLLRAELLRERDESYR